MAKDEGTERVKDPNAIAVKAKEIAFRPKNFEELWKFATLICKTEFVPDSFRDNAGACLAAIQTGHELGLPPMASLQSIAVIKGRPTVWGDGALALVKAHRLCEWVHELPAEKALEQGYGECTIKRRGDPIPITRKFSVAMATAAELWGGTGDTKEKKERSVWFKYPGRMLQMRARSWAMRDAIPEALKGVAIREEVEDYEQLETVPDKQDLPPDGKPALQQLKESLKAEVAPKPEPEPAKEPEHPEVPPDGLPVDPVAVIVEDLEKAFREATTPAQVDKAYVDNFEVMQKLPKEIRQRLDEVHETCKAALKKAKAEARV